MGSTYFVTGSSGLLGRSLVHRLAQETKQIRTYDLFFEERLPPQAAQIPGDIRNLAKLSQAMQGSEVVFHLAGRMPQWRLGKDGFYDVNVRGTENVIAAAVENGVRRIVFASTIEIYGAQRKYPLREGDPKLFTGEYSRNKLRCEELLLQASSRHGLEVVMLRLPVILGAGFYHERSILLLFRLIRLNLPVLLAGDPKAPAAFAHLEDAAEAFYLAGVKEGVTGEAFNIACDQAPPIGRLLGDLVRKVGSRSLILPVPLFLLAPVSALLRRLDLPLPGTGTPAELLPFALSGAHYDVTKAKHLLGFQPRWSPLDGLLQTYHWFAQHRREALKERRRQGL